MTEPPAPPFRLGVLTALWGRPAVASAVLAHTASLEVPGVSLDLVAVRSPEDPAPTPEADGWRYVDAPNAPLSDKWNAGAEELMDVDAVMVIGSDDLVTPEYVAAAAAHVRDGADLVHLGGALFIEPATERAWHVRPSRMGAGRVLSARVLERLDWTPWPSGLDRRLDAGMDARMHRSGRGPQVLVPPDPEHVLIDVKTGESMWTLDQMAKWRSGSVPWPAVRALLSSRFPLALPLLTMPSTTGSTALPDGVEDLGGGWYQVGDEKVQGRDKAIEAAEHPERAAGTHRDAPEAEAEPAPKGSVEMRALKNIPGDRAGTARRVYRGDVFDAPGDRVRDLKRLKLAEATS